MGAKAPDKRFMVVSVNPEDGEDAEGPYIYGEALKEAKKRAQDVGGDMFILEIQGFVRYSTPTKDLPTEGFKEVWPS